MRDPIGRDDVLVVVPALNEQDTVADVVRALGTAGYRTVVVNDGSTDATSERARDAGALVLDLPVNLGVGGALRCGFAYAVSLGYRVVAQVDADGQHSPADIDRLLEVVESDGAHMVTGSRFRGSHDMDIGPARRLAMRLLSRSASRATGVSITDATSGFRVIREPLLSLFAENFPNYYLGDTYEAVVAAGRGGFVVRETAATFRPRQGGLASAGPLKAFRFTVKALTSALLRLYPRIGGGATRLGEPSPHG
jgi:glycosyltransferase involved in cell wall biosynthesis